MPEKKNANSIHKDPCYSSCLYSLPGIPVGMWLGHCVNRDLKDIVSCHDYSFGNNPLLFPSSPPDRVIWTSESKDLKGE